jgi:hypothetical protein
MSAPVKLESSSDRRLPLFYPGQVLSDAALSGIATFARSGLKAESLRHGWGIIHGLFPSAKTHPDRVTISRGMAADQDGRLFVLDRSETKELTRLFSQEAENAAKRGETEFDLWLSIDTEQVGQKVPFRTIGVKAGFAAAVNPPGRPDVSHPLQENLVAYLELRVTSKLQEYEQEESKIVEKFEGDFNEETINWKSEIPDEATLEKIRGSRAEVLAELYGRDPVRYGGIPLGRVTVEKSTLRIVKVDCGLARREQAPLLLPSTPGHINSTALFDLERDKAVNWLACNGFPRWTVQALTDDDVGQQLRGDKPSLWWDVELRVGTTARLYTNNGRIALVKQGPTIEDEFGDILCQIGFLYGALSVLFLLLVAVAVTFLYYH